MSVIVRLHSPGEYAPIADRVYHRDPGIFTSELTTVSVGEWPTDGVLPSASDRAGLIGAAVRKPPDSLLISGIPVEAAEVVAQALASADDKPPSIRGLCSVTTALAETSRIVTGAVPAIELEGTLGGVTLAIMMQHRCRRKTHERFRTHAAALTAGEQVRALVADQPVRVAGTDIYPR